MKKIVSAAVLLSVLSVLFLPSCSGTAEFEYTDGMLVNKKTKEKYSAAPVGYEPCGVGEEYGKFGEFVLYGVEGINGEAFPAEKWLTEEYSGSATTLFYGEGAVLAPFEEMAPDVCYVCEEDINVISVATVTDETALEALCTALSEQDGVLLPLTDIKETYSLKFYSADYPQYFYSATYCVCESGNYVYRAGGERAFEIGNLLDTYMGSAG